jgi:Protein of unknown function (DUF1064)
MNKYHNRPQVIDGHKYRSKREAQRHQELLLLERERQIIDLRREVPFVLAPKIKYSDAARATPALRYVADFTYFDRAKGEHVVEDAKGVRTEGYRLKRHLMMTVHNIEVLET